MNNLEIPHTERRTEIAKQDPCADTYDLGYAKQIIGDLRNTPEELERVIRSAPLFFALLDEKQRERALDHSEGTEGEQREIDTILRILRSSPIAGEGTSNRFRIPRQEHRDVIRAYFGSLVGLREMKRAEIVDPKTGRRYLGIQANPDQPDPINRFRHGTMVQAIIATTKPTVMPNIYRYSEERGARDIDTGELIQGLEDEIVGLSAIMEVLNGPSVAQIIDKDGEFWKKRYSARKPNEFRDFLESEEYRAYIHDSIETAINEWPGLLTIDWSSLGDTLDAVFKEYNSLSGGIAGLFKDGHMGNIGIVFHDEQGLLPASQPIKVMDPDTATLSTRIGFGNKAEDFINPDKSNSLRTEYFMPDRIPHSMDRKEREALGIDSVMHLKFMFALIGDIVREIIEKKSSDRRRPR